MLYLSQSYIKVGTFSIKTQLISFFDRAKRFSFFKKKKVGSLRHNSQVTPVANLREPTTLCFPIDPSNDFEYAQKKTRL